MIKNIEVRRPSLFIFVFILITALIYINQNKHYGERVSIKNRNFHIDMVEKKNSKLYLYSKNIIIRQNYISDEYIPGDILKISGQLEDILSLKNKKYGLYLKSKGYDHIIHIDKLEKIGHKTSYKSLIYKIRQNISLSIEYLYNDYADIIKALLIADRQGISKDETELFSRSGVSHIISISGFHILLISSIFFNFLFFLPIKKRYIASSLMTFFYIALTGFKSPSVRAYIFYITYLTAVYKGERYDIFSIGFILASIYMVINPYIIYDSGFCLSFLSVFSIAIFYNRIFTNLKKLIKNKRYDFILSLISLTISAQILTIPYVYYNFGTISVISIISNIISVPLISLSYPFILLSVLFIKVFFIRDVFANIVNIIMFLFYKSNVFLTSLPFSYLSFEYRSFEKVIIFYILIFSFNHIYIKNKILKNKYELLKTKNIKNKQSLN